MNSTETIRIELPETFPCVHCGEDLEPGPLDPFDRVACPHCGGTVIVPGRIDQFRVLDRLGKGGMGVVFLAEDTVLKRQVALKSVRADKVANDLEFSQLLNEAKTAATLNHPNIAKVYSFEATDSGVYIVMEFVEGNSLKHFLADREPLDYGFVARMGAELTSALQAAEQVGLTHSDIKPANILITDRGRAKLVDFGLARFRKDSDPDEPLWGSPFYIAPERLARERETVRSDQYSLGATLWHCLTGRPPFKGPTRKDTLLNVRQGAFPHVEQDNPDAPTELCRVVERMMARDPWQRYPTYASLLSDLDRVRTRIAPEAASGGRPTRRPARRISPIVWLMVVGGVLGLVVGLVALKFAAAANDPGPPVRPAPRPAPVPDPPVRSGENLLGNASFERPHPDGKPHPAGWFVKDVGNARATRFEGDGTHGKACVELRFPQPRDAKPRLHRKITLEPQTEYRLSARIKTIDLRCQPPQSGAAVMIKVDGRDYPLAITRPRRKGTRDWTEVSVEFRTVAEDTYRVFCVLGEGLGTVQGAARFDDLRLQRRLR